MKHSKFIYLFIYCLHTPPSDSAKILACIIPACRASPALKKTKSKPEHLFLSREDSKGISPKSMLVVKSVVMLFPLPQQSQEAAFPCYSK